MAFAVVSKLAVAVTVAVAVKVGYENREWIQEQILKLVSWVRKALSLQPAPIDLFPLSEEEQKLQAASESFDHRGYEELMCPISHKLLLDPVITPYKHCYDREAIETWLKKEPTCPITRQPLHIEDLRPCPPMRVAVEQYLHLREKLKEE